MKDDRFPYLCQWTPWLNGGTEELTPYLKMAAEAGSLLGPEKVYPFYCLARHCLNLPGDFWELGVYKGGTASILTSICGDKELHLFDTFDGIPFADPIRDSHRQGDFKAEESHTKQNVLRHALHNLPYFHAGLLPDTFAGMEHSRIAFCHVDLDTYQSYKDCLPFVYNHMVAGGIILMDDYGAKSCPGAKLAADEFFGDKPEPIIGFMTGQAFIIKVEVEER